MSINEYMIRRYPELDVKMLTGSDNGMTKKEYLEDINATLKASTIFVCSPVIESSVDINLTNEEGIWRAELAKQLTTRLYAYDSPTQEV